MEFLLKNNMIVANTFFRKSEQGYCTYKNLETPQFAPPWTPERLATADDLICKQRWKNSIQDVEIKTQKAFPSDHYLGIARIKISRLLHLLKIHRVHAHM